jgi:hypothetical protein
VLLFPGMNSISKGRRMSQVEHLLCLISGSKLEVFGKLIFVSVVAVFYFSFCCYADSADSVLSSTLIFVSVV